MSDVIDFAENRNRLLQSQLTGSVEKLGSIEAYKREQREKRQAKLNEARGLLNSPDTTEFIRGVDIVIELQGIEAGLQALKMRIIKGA